MTGPTSSIKSYRSCVGIALFNKDGKVWMGRRAGASGDYVWQMPQGGMDRGESPEFAAMRELYEETGVLPTQLKPLGHIEDWLYYDLPAGHGNKRMNKYRGQRQRWFAYRFKGKDSDFNLKVQRKVEFTDFKWTKLSKTPDMIVPFKKCVYERIVLEFERFARAPK